jgi:hypothetical protein
MFKQLSISPQENNDLREVVVSHLFCFFVFEYLIYSSTTPIVCINISDVNNFYIKS